VLKIRLRRTGARKRPNYRLVVADSAAPRDGQYIEIIGFYDPLTDPATVRIDSEKARTWITKGAKPTERVARLLAREGIVEQPAAVGA
jgi:small subunit ribosomal protein S16